MRRESRQQPHHYPGGNLREDLLKKGRRELERYGVEKIRLEDLRHVQRGEKKGVNRAAVYYHFRSKKELLNAIAARAIGELKDRVKGCDPLSPKERLTNMVASLLEFADKNPQTYRLINSEIFAASEPSLDPLADTVQRIMVEIRDLFVKAAHEAGLAPDQMWTVLIFMHGLAVIDAPWLHAAWPSLSRELHLDANPEHHYREALGRRLLKPLLLKRS